ncbi:CHAT domain-containing protein [Luteolibacter sp. SL250]|uniref:CHAT domain-containing protein n=1 Tax=Luteolibacter sp. SL250 TaxID=2995170 RepID=UPI002270FCA7|nr:CHAT domain-containing protein [Luteolibacter sp. SL250]WAC20323.1 CHAT domain-containing protein [Luteolibacter sp. SL250]
MSPYLLSLVREGNNVRVSLLHDGVSDVRIAEGSSISDLTKRTETLLESDEPPSTSEIRSLGLDLGMQLLGDLLSRIISIRGTLWITSTDPVLVNLPFELLTDSDGGFLIESGHLFLRRTTDPAAMNKEATAPVPGPLRVLFMACSPDSESRLSFEKEEENLLKACSSAGPGVHLEIEESGTFEGLQQKIISYRPHIVHLSGHAAFHSPSGSGSFAFEDASGNTDLRSAYDISDILFRNSGVRLAFLSGCDTARAGPAGIAQKLAESQHVPLVLGWGLPVLDDIAIQFATTLFRDLGAGRGIDIAIDHARAVILKTCTFSSPDGTPRILADFALPRLYAACPVDRLLNPALPEDRPPRPTFRPSQLKDGIQGLASGFVGRRRILQRTFPVLQDPASGKWILLLTGIGGGGKSTLATRLANRLEAAGMTIVSLRLRADEPAPQFLLRILIDLHVAAKALSREVPLADAIIDGKLEVSIRIRYAIEVLNQLPILLVLDNLEDLMPAPPAPPTWTDTNLALFFTELANGLIGRSRAILTCRYIPAGLDPANAPTVFVQPMPDFTSADFFKFSEYHERVSSRLATGEITHDLLAEFHRKLGATPGFVRQALDVLATLDPAEIRSTLATLEETTASDQAGHTSDPIRELQQEYFTRLFLTQLYDALSPAHRTALSRLAVCDIAIPFEAVAAVTALDETETGSALQAWTRLGLVQIFPEETEAYSVYPLQRKFLLGGENIASDVLRQSHLELSKWLKGYMEGPSVDKEIDLFPLLIVCLGSARKAESPELIVWSSTNICKSFALSSNHRTILALALDILRKDRFPELLKIAAQALYHLSNWSKARAYFREAEEGYRKQGNISGQATAIVNEALIDSRQGNLDAAEQGFRRGLRLQISINDFDGQVMTWLNRAGIDERRGKYVSAKIKIRKCLRMLILHKNPDAEAFCRNMLGKIHHATGDRKNARHEFEACMKIRIAMEDLAGQAASAHQIATLDSEEGNYKDAKTNYLFSIKIHQLLGDRVAEGYNWMGIAGISLNQNGATLIGVRLAAVGWSLLNLLGIGDQETAWANLTGIAAELEMPNDAFHAEIDRTFDSYRADRGTSLLAAAFPEDASA